MFEFSSFKGRSSHFLESLFAAGQKVIKKCDSSFKFYSYRLDVLEKAVYQAEMWSKCWCDMDGNCARTGNVRRGMENGGQTEAEA